MPLLTLLCSCVFRVEQWISSETTDGQIGEEGAVHVLVERCHWQGLHDHARAARTGGQPLPPPRLRLRRRRGKRKRGEALTLMYVRTGGLGDESGWFAI